MSVRSSETQAHAHTHKHPPHTHTHSCLQRLSKRRKEGREGRKGNVYSLEESERVDKEVTIWEEGEIKR